jgi:hypothetical protein
VLQRTRPQYGRTIVGMSIEKLFYSNIKYFAGTLDVQRTCWCVVRPTETQAG